MLLLVISTGLNHDFFAMMNAAAFFFGSHS